MIAKVSIIIAAYNAQEYLQSTLDSVIKQVWPNLEIIVINDGSTDLTPSILETYSKPNFKIIHQKNLGQNAALNNGFKISTGQYIKFMDSDDLINPEMIKLQVEALIKYPNSIAYCEWARFYNNKPELADFTSLDNWKNMSGIDFLITSPQGPMLQCGIMLIPRHLIEIAGNWNENILLYNDTEFFTRLILISHGIIFSKGAKLFYRSGTNTNLSSQKSRKYFEATYFATCLIAEHLLKVERSVRVKNLISNMFLVRYQEMYPNFPDLGKMHEKMIKYYGMVKYNQGGKITRLLNNLIGWKLTKRIKNIFLKP